MGDIPKYLSDAGTRAALLDMLLDHVYLSLVPLVVSIVLAIVLGLLCHRFPRVNATLVALSRMLGMRDQWFHTWLAPWAPARIAGRASGQMTRQPSGSTASDC